jgi:hypothetical protein
LHLVRYFDISALEYINSSVKPALKLIISLIIIKMELCLFMRLWPCFCYFYVCHAIQPTNGYASLKKLSPPFIGVLIFLVSSNKSNDLLIFTIPSSYHGNKSYRNTSVKLKQEMVLIVLIACLCLPFSQL